MSVTMERHSLILDVSILSGAFSAAVMGEVSRRRPAGVCSKCGLVSSSQTNGRQDSSVYPPPGASVGSARGNKELVAVALWGARPNTAAWPGPTIDSSGGSGQIRARSRSGRCRRPRGSGGWAEEEIGRDRAENRRTPTTGGKAGQCLGSRITGRNRVL
jgi:hypothetical protein